MDEEQDGMFDAEAEEALELLEGLLGAVGRGRAAHCTLSRLRRSQARALAPQFFADMLDDPDAIPAVYESHEPTNLEGLAHLAQVLDETGRAYAAGQPGTLSAALAVNLEQAGILLEGFTAAAPYTARERLAGFSYMAAGNADQVLTSNGQGTFHSPGQGVMCPCPNL